MEKEWIYELHTNTYGHGTQLIKPWIDHTNSHIFSRILYTSKNHKLKQMKICQQISYPVSWQTKVYCHCYNNVNFHQETLSKLREFHEYRYEYDPESCPTIYSTINDAEYLWITQENLRNRTNIVIHWNKKLIFVCVIYWCMNVHYFQRKWNNALLEQYIFLSKYKIYPTSKYFKKF